MTIVHADNFSIYGTDTALMDDGIYAQANGALSLVADPDGLSSGRVLQLASSAVTRPIVRFVMPTAEPVVGSAMRIWCSPLPEADNIRSIIASYRDGSNNQFATIMVQTTGRLIFEDGTNTIETAVPVISANAWWHIEIKYDRSGSGSLEVRVEGLTVIDEPDLGYVGATDIFQVAFVGPGSNFSDTDIYLKDYVIWDSNGAYNNDFLGSVLVHTLAPTSDVALNWTPSTGAAGWSILDNVPPNDAQYISAGTPAPSPYICELSDLPAEVTSVKALMSIVRAQKTDGGDGSLQVSAISNGDIVNGANRPITIAMTYWRDVFETDPDTGVPWLPEAVNLAQLQIDRTDS